jgi:hypothetical protein
MSRLFLLVMANPGRFRAQDLPCALREYLELDRRE